MDPAGCASPDDSLLGLRRVPSAVNSATAGPRDAPLRWIWCVRMVRLELYANQRR